MGKRGKQRKSKKRNQDVAHGDNMVQQNATPSSSRGDRSLMKKQKQQQEQLPSETVLSHGGKKQEESTPHRLNATVVGRAKHTPVIESGMASMSNCSSTTKYNQKESKRQKTCCISIQVSKDDKKQQPTLECNLGDDSDSEGSQVDGSNAESTSAASRRLLQDLLAPCPVNDFLQDYFRQCAVHVPGLPHRFTAIRRALGIDPSRYSRNQDNDDDADGNGNIDHNKPTADPDVLSLFQQTASENIFVWIAGPQKPEQPYRASEMRPDKSIGKAHSPSMYQISSRQPPASISNLIRSIEISDPSAAHALYQAGHATYCRAPIAMEQMLVPALLRQTGMGLGQYDRGGLNAAADNSNIVVPTQFLGRGEVEVFCCLGSSYNGSKSFPSFSLFRPKTTGWHTDFQENFTLQLSGSKRWTFQSGVIAHPLRGCTPHYDSPDVVEGQLKAARLATTTTLQPPSLFQFGPPNPTELHNAGDECASITMQAGDVLYHPAGIWHQVEVIETTEPCISINISLMACSYASLVCQSLQHVLLQNDVWRQCIVHNSQCNAMETLRQLLTDLPRQVERLTGHNCGDGGAAAILPPCLWLTLDQHQNQTDNPRNDHSTKGDDDRQIHDRSDETNDNGGNDTDENSAMMIDSRPFASRNPNDDANDSAASDSDDEGDGDDGSIVDTEMFDLSSLLSDRLLHSKHVTWVANERELNHLQSTHVLIQNPLALLMQQGEITKYYDPLHGTNRTHHSSSSFSSSSSKHNPKIDAAPIYVLNVNYAGNESHESLIRVRIRAQLDDMAWIKSLLSPHHRQVPTTTTTTMLSHLNSSITSNHGKCDDDVVRDVATPGKDKQLIVGVEPTTHTAIYYPKKEASQRQLNLLNCLIYYGYLLWVDLS